MKNYPKTPPVLFTAQDWDNLLADDRFAERAKRDLETIRDLDDDKVTRCIQVADPDDPNSKDIIELIDNPAPTYRRGTGCKTRAEMTTRFKPKPTEMVIEK